MSIAQRAFYRVPIGPLRCLSRRWFGCPDSKTGMIRNFLPWLLFVPIKINFETCWSLNPLSSFFRYNEKKSLTNWRTRTRDVYLTAFYSSKQFQLPAARRRNRKTKIINPNPQALLPPHVDENEDIISYKITKTT